MLRPRTLGKIVIAILIVAALATSFLFVLETGGTDELYKGARAITYAIIALTFATVYRYFED